MKQKGNSCLSIAIFLISLLLSLHFAHAAEHFQFDTNGTLTAGLTSYYKEENSTDFYGGNNLSDTAINYVAGKVNNSASYSNANNSLQTAGNVFDDDSTHPMSVEFWIKSSSTYSSGSMVFISKQQDGGTYSGWDIENANGTSGYVQFDFYAPLGYPTNRFIVQAQTTNVLDGNWHDVVATYDGSGSGYGANIYVDGSLESSTVLFDSLSGSTSNSVAATIMGRAGDRFGAGLDVKVDEVGVWSKALDQQEVTDLWHGGNGQTMDAGNTPYIIALKQFKSDATTTIAEGSTTTESTVAFGATLGGSTTTEELQVEVEPIGVGFSNVANVVSSPVSAGSNVTVAFASSTAIDPSVYPRDPEIWSDGSFHWQARVIDSNGITSTWQAATAHDFTINTVPLYTQEESDYPSDASTTSWATAAYDNALPGTGCGAGANSSTIEACGCAISSVAMWLQYFGIATDTLGNPVNPGSLNTWLEATSSGGYDAEGDLEWGAVEHYASTTDGGSVIFASSSFDYDHEPVSVLESYINPLINSSTPDPVILVEDNAPDGAGTTEHWLVAIASSTYNGTSTYAIRDSFWYNTQYLNQPTSTGPGTVNFYNNNIDGIRIYYDPPKPPLFNEYHINLPNTLMLVDSQGRRTGKDPATGVIYREIPGAAYGEDNKSGELFFSEPSNGQYALYVLGGETGTYHFDAWIDNGKNQAPPQRISGDIQAGSMVAYRQNYEMLNLAASTLSFNGAVSSTTNITALPPDNLPLPPPIVPDIHPAPLPTVRILQPTLAATSTGFVTSSTHE